MRISAEPTYLGYVIEIVLLKLDSASAALVTAEFGSQFHTSPELCQTHVKTELSKAESVRITEHFVDLYTKGLSLTDIYRQTGKAKNTIRGALIRAGVELRSNISVPVSQAARGTGKSNIRPYFGFCYFNGKIVPDPREYENLVFIHKLWKSKTNPNRIATILNEKKIPCRSSAKWNRNSVVLILNRFKEGTISIKGDSYEFK